MLDAKSERTVAAVADQLQVLFGTELVAVALYGSAAGSDFVPGRSDINIAVVLNSLEYQHLHALKRHTPRWRKDRVATPLVLDRAFLRSAADVFPMELNDLRTHHRIVYGEDVFAILVVNDTNLRYQCEHEARGKLLRLRELYIELGDNEGNLQGLMLDSLKTFLVVMRHLSRLRDQPHAPSYETVLDVFSRTFQCQFPTMNDLLQIKLGKAEWSGEVEELFRHYLGEVEKLVQVIDGLETR